MGRRRKRWRQTFAVFAGPSDDDIAALPHVEEAWCVAEFICAELGLRSDVWIVIEQTGDLNVHVRYGLMLDWVTRDVAQRMARERGTISTDNAYQHYGLDPIRVALEHGATPDELDELCANATHGIVGVSRRSPLAEGRKGRPRTSGMTPKPIPASARLRRSRSGSVTRSGHDYSPDATPTAAAPHKSGSALAYQFFGHPLMRLTKRVAVSP